QELAALQEALTKNLLAQLASLSSADLANRSNRLETQPLTNNPELPSQLDAKALMALIAQRDSNTPQQSTPQGTSVANVTLANPEIPVDAGDAVRVLAVEPSLAQELKIKQLMDLDQKFTLGQGARALGEQNVEQASSLSELIAAQSTLDEHALKDFNLIHGASAKPSKDLDLLPVDDASGNFLLAAQTAQASAPIATPTQIALSMQDASMVRGPLH
ncbi:MAG: hypothetical protein ACKOXA_12435, partial [Polynucleobacter sp.]